VATTSKYTLESWRYVSLLPKACLAAVFTLFCFWTYTHHHCYAVVSLSVGAKVCSYKKTLGKTFGGGDQPLAS
jgi:hypothetical protein